jgi:hypothetical protein
MSDDPEADATPGERRRPEASVSDLPPRTRALVVCGLAGFGLFMLAVGLRIVGIAPSRGVPYWLVDLVGVLFLLAAVAAALPARPSRLHDVVGALIFTGFAVMALWIGAGPGERHFGGTGLSLGPVTVEVSSGPSVGRVAFTVAGALIALVAVLAWRRVFRRRDPPGGTGPA